MTADFSSDFDARRVGWWQRRSVVRRIKRIPWLTGADRDLRVQRARAAHTRGELNALTRDLAVGGPLASTQAVWTPPPAVQSYGQVPQAQPATARPLQAPVTPAKRSARTPLLIGGLVLLVTCGGGLVSCVGAIVDTVSDATSVSPPDDLLSDDGWSTMIGDLDGGIDVRRVVDIVVQRQAATVTLPSGDDSTISYYYDGDISATESGDRNQARVEFDLALVEGPMVEDAVDQARQRAGVGDATEASVYVSATVRDEPTLMVTFPDEQGSYSLVVDLDGTIVSENIVS